jgi:hypothetical protein
MNKEQKKILADVKKFEKYGFKLTEADKKMIAWQLSK